jgi:hypothetical protein
MPFAVRALVLCLLAFSAAGCGGSNNKEKIEGRWRFVPGDSPDAAKLRDAVLSFGAGGEVLLTFPGAPKPVAWRYKLLAGDAVDFYDLAPDAAERGGLFPTTADERGVTRVTIRIEVTPEGRFERRAMVLTDAQGRVLHLVRARE